MKCKLFLLIFFLIAIYIKSVQGQSFNFGIRHGANLNDGGRITTTDAENNIYTLVFYYGTLTIDSLGTPVTIGTYGNRDIVIIKYNCLKVFQWAVRVGGPFLDGGSFNMAGLKADASGNIYASATMNGSTNFTSSNGNVQVRNSLGQYDAFVMKINNSGIIQWVNQIGSTGNDEGGSLTIDRENNVYSTGLFYNSATCQSIGSSSSIIGSFGSSDIFVVKYNSSGSLVYASRGGSSNMDVGDGIAVDSSGSAYVAGNFGPSVINFGANNINNTTNWGGFIAKMDPNGTWLWGNGMGGTADEALQDVVVDDIADRVYTIGHFNGSTVVTTRPGGTAQSISASAASYDAVLISMDLNGGTKWARVMGSTGTDYGFGIDLDPKRNIVVSGDFRGTTNFGGQSLTASGTASAYCARYSPNNVLLDAYKVGNGAYTNGWNVHVSTTGLTYLTGYFQGQNILGSDTLTSAGAEDAYVARIQFSDTTFIGLDKSALNCLRDTAVLYVPNKRIGNFYWFRNDTLLTLSNTSQILITKEGTYKVVNTSNCANPDTSINIVVNRSSIYSAVPISDITICKGDSGQFHALDASNYYWTPTVGLSNANIANPKVMPGINTTYYLRRTMFDCSAFDTVDVSLLTNCCLTCATPLNLNNGVVACYPFNGNANDESGNGNNATVYNATLTNDRFAVANKAYQFNGFSSYLEVPNSPTLQSPGNNISFTFWARVTSWNFNSGVQYNPILSKSVTPASGQYRAMIRNNGAFAMSPGGNSFDGVIGSTTNTATWYFFAISVSNDTMYYYRNGNLLGFATGPVAFTLNNTTPLRIGKNDINTPVFFSGSMDEVRIYGRTLTAAEVKSLYNLSNINGKPTISAGLDKIICSGDSVQLTTVGTNGTYLWTPNIYLSADTAKSPWCKADSTKRYYVKVDVSGCYNHDTINVNVNNFQPIIWYDQTICRGDTASLVVLNGGNTFAWTPNYKINNLVNDTIKVFPQVDTNYIVASNNGLCIRRDTVRITVTSPTINAGLDQNICLHDTAKFTVVSNGAVSWSPFRFLSDSVGNSVYSVPDSNITYIATANYLGCLAHDTISVSVAVLPVDAGPNVQICKGDTIQLNATGATNFIWLPRFNISDSSIANPKVWPTSPMYYYVVSYNLLCSRYDSVFVNVKEAAANAGLDKSICNGDSVQLAANVIGPYTWSPLASLSDTSLHPWAKPASTTSYILSVNNFGCLASDTVKVSVSNFNISAGSDKLICKGDSVQLNATGGTKYNWLPNYFVSDTGKANPWVKPPTPTRYFLLSSNGICLRIDTINVDVRTISGSAGLDTSICYGYFVKLKANGGATYTWLNNYNLSDPNIADPIATPAFDTSYYVKITDTTNCSVYDTVHVRVDAFPFVDAGISQKHCPKEFVTLYGTGKDYTRFFWSPPIGLSDINIMQPEASVTTNTTYTLNAWNNYCYNSDTVLVEVNPQVVSKFNTLPETGLAPLQVFFVNNSQNAYFYAWEFGVPGASGNTKDTSFIYRDEGTYLVRLIAKDSMGCSDTSTTSVKVIVTETLFVPTAFSPNGDGLNDEFEFKLAESRFEYLEMSIFNRWGVEVFRTKMPGGVWWDGKVNGQPEPSGVFTYYAVARDKKGKTYERKGSVTIVR